jgi:hypothetical protein
MMIEEMSYEEENQEPNESSEEWEAKNPTSEQQDTEVEHS